MRFHSLAERRITDVSASCHVHLLPNKGISLPCLSYAHHFAYSLTLGGTPAISIGRSKGRNGVKYCGGIGVGVGSAIGVGSTVGLGTGVSVGDGVAATVTVGLARIHRRTPMDGVRAAEGGG